MKTTFISTQAISESTRLSVAKLQLKLSDAQKEVVTGRLADVGLTLGYKTGEAVSLRQEYERINTMIDTNGVVETRLSLTQTSLQAIVDGAQNLVGDLLAARSSDTGPALVQRQAEMGLRALLDKLNTASNDAYLFAGINTDVKPLTDYFQTPTPASKQSVADAFLTEFGITQSDPGVEAITAADMQTFLDTTFATLFDTAAWTANWSSASDQNVRSRVSTYELLETSTNANESAIRKLASAFTMVADLGTENLNQSAFYALVDTAVQRAGEAVQELSLLQGTLGAVQERVSIANETMSIQVDIMASHINLLEAVDPAEASTRVSSLLTQLETAYALTARLHQLSVLNYL
jgi:flagellar hook-associated protein 3 FlgL